MESKSFQIDSAQQLNYECNNGHIWVKTLEDTELLFKYYDASVKEEKDPKKIKDDQIFPKTSQTQKIKKFTSLKAKIAKEALNLEIDTPVYVNTLKQYGVIRKIIKTNVAVEEEADQSKKEDSTAVQYEVRLSNSLENVIASSSDLKRLITINIRIHSTKGAEAQNINIQVKVDSTVIQLLQYVSQIAQVPPNFINLYHKKKRLANSDYLFRENIIDGDNLLCLQGQGDMHVFHRFKVVSSSGWCYSQTSWDAITWRPNRTVMIAGFGVYGLTSGQQNFFVRYKYVVQNTPGDEIEVEVMSTEIDETSKIYPVMFEGDMIEVPAGTDFTVQMRGYGANNNYRVRGYYGYNGNSYKSFDNQDRDLFEITYSSLSSNGTGVDSGQVPSLYYYLVG